MDKWSGAIYAVTDMVPIALGRGIHLFPENHAQRVALVESEQFGDGITLLRYVNA